MTKLSEIPRPTIGRIVLYMLAGQDAEEINRRRGHATANLSAHRERSDGSQIHAGNSVAAGDVYPLVITRVWGLDVTSAVNGQVLLDGNDTFWATSVTAGDGPRHFTWPQRS
ncbi:MAG: hypothetical protein ACREN2_13525 [Candidatus Dormibacteria bacterium]